MTEKTVCTVCEMSVEMEKAPFKREYKGRSYYFCCPKCEQAFKANPEEYCTRWASKVPG